MATFELSSLVGCSSNKQKIEQTIANYIQTNIHGGCEGLNFSMVIMDVRYCTVADSIRNLIEDAKEEIESAIQATENKLHHWQVKMKQSDFATKVESEKRKDSYQRKIDSDKCRIKLLRKTDPARIALCDGINPDTLLAIYVTCHYGVEVQCYGTFQEKTETFILTPDGKSVIGQK